LRAPSTTLAALLRLSATICGGRGLADRDDDLLDVDLELIACDLPHRLRVVGTNLVISDGDSASDGGVDDLELEELLPEHAAVGVPGESLRL
jgi:hypothetical protein